MLVLQGGNKINIYIDGSCQPNPGQGAWAVLVLDKDEKEIARLTGRIKEETTNNRAEIIAAENALRFVPAGAEATIFTDSALIVNSMNNNWKRNQNKDIYGIVLIPL